MMIFKDRPYRAHTVGGFVFSFSYKEGDARRTYLNIDAKDGTWGVRIGGNTHAFGYLLAAYGQGMDEQLHGYAVLLYTAGMAMTQDQGLTDSLVKAISKYTRRKLKEGEKAAMSVTENDETVAQAFMEGAIERGRLKSKKEITASREEMRKILTGNGESD